jgi:hypothetical protein
LDEQPAKASKPNLRLVPQAPPPVTAEGAGAPAQAEMPFAVVEGEPVTELPRDLYIPPYALEVFLEAFEGPLDLLLYLIRRQNLDILDIPIAEISRQYVPIHRPHERDAVRARGRVSRDGRNFGRDQIANAVATLRRG